MLVSSSQDLDTFAVFAGGPVISFVDVLDLGTHNVIRTFS